MAMQAPLQAFDRVASLGNAGMLTDIWETPTVLRQMVQKHVKAGASAATGDFNPPARCNRVEIPSLQQPLPQGHSKLGRTPLEVMAACTQDSGSFKNKFTIIGCGTSWHAALVAEYLIEHIARIPVDVQYASEFRYRQPIVRPGDVLIIVSNSGETSDAVESLRMVRRCPGGSDILIVGICNEANSTVARESDAFIAATAGAEVGVASTKAFSCTVLAFVLLAVALGQASGTLPEAERDVLLEKLEELPDLVQEVLDRESRPLRQKEDSSERSLEIGECTLWDIGCQNVLANNFIFLGRGLNFPIALEGAMKCKELAYIHAEGYPAAEMKHGPIALIDQFMPVVVIAPRSDPTYEKIKANIEEVKARSGSTIAITERYNSELEGLCEYVIGVPPTHEYLMPLISVIPLQLLAYMMGILRGNEVDNPRGLQKSVTAEAEALIA